MVRDAVVDAAIVLVELREGCLHARLLFYAVRTAARIGRIRASIAGAERCLRLVSLHRVYKWCELLAGRTAVHGAGRGTNG